MKFRSLIAQNLRFYARAHLGVLLGTAVGGAVLTGALLVGDSVRGSLRHMALSRLAGAEFVVTAGDRLFLASLADRLQATQPDLQTTALLRMPAAVSRGDGTARANSVQLWGVSALPPLSRSSAAQQIPPNHVLLNAALASRLGAKAGDSLIFRLPKPTSLSRDAVITPRNDMTLALRLQVAGIVEPDAPPPHHFANLDLKVSQLPPLNAFVRREELAAVADVAGKANVLLIAGPLASTAQLAPALRKAFTVEDAELQLRYLPGAKAVELASPRIFLDGPVVRAATNIAAVQASVQLTYLANLIRAGAASTPYSMITAAGAPYTPADLGDDEILINDWLAEDLAVGPGSTLEVSYYVADTGAELVERTNQFRVRGIVPLAGAHADRTLMPEFPGLAKAESTHDWDAGFPLLHKIREKDEAYWKTYRGTPKAFISLRAGQKLWTNRFGAVTAVRWPVTNENARTTIAAELRQQIDPAVLGFTALPLRQQALAAVDGGQDFGQLFLGLSFFLIVAALILVGLLFQFGLEQRASEVGILLATGFLPKKVRRLYLCETMMVASVGAAAGLAAAVVYAHLMLQGLSTVWQDAVRTSALQLHVDPATLVIGFLATLVVSGMTLLLVLRKLGGRPARELLTEGGAHVPALTVRAGRWPTRVGLVLVLTAAGFLLFGLSQRQSASPTVFFTAGPLLLLAGLLLCRGLLTAMAARLSRTSITLGALGFRGTVRRHRRTLAVIALLASGTFMIIAVGANRRDATRDALARPSGTGGFPLLGQTALPVVHDLNSTAGREFFGLSDADLAGVAFVPFRVREGDDASCLNLTRAQRPRVLGVKPGLLAQRRAFTFVNVSAGLPRDWTLLQTSSADTPVVGDENSIRWALGRRVGDALDLVDAAGRPFRARVAGAVANSILQGHLIMSEAEFLRRYPDESGYRMFLIDVPSNRVAEVTAGLTRAMQDVGLELIPAARRLNEYNSVQNTYLKTFQMLGGLGLLLGSVGLGIVVLRNVFERRGELAVLQAVGLRRRRISWYVLSEHLGLLLLGLVVGVVAAGVAVFPALLAPGGQVHGRALLALVAGIFISGLLWTWLATRWALRGDLLKALRNE